MKKNQLGQQQQRWWPATATTNATTKKLNTQPPTTKTERNSYCEHTISSIIIIKGKKKERKLGLINWFIIPTTT